MKNLLFAGVVAIAACVTPVEAETLASAEKLLRAAMTANANGEGRALDSGVAIRAYIDQKAMRRKPEKRADYTDYRIMRAPATLFGHNILALEEEYMITHIGCCVDPGLAAVLDLRGSSAAIEAFARENKCRWEAYDKSYSKEMLDQLLPPHSSSVFVISCRERSLTE
jgi:hypothetical protein